MDNIDHKIYEMIMYLTAPNSDIPIFSTEYNMSNGERAHRLARRRCLHALKKKSCLSKKMAVEAGYKIMSATKAAFNHKFA